jgi:hypothetical protein
MVLVLPLLSGSVAMNRMLVLVFVLVADAASAEAMTLQLPGKASVTFDAPQVTKLKEITEGNRYQYLASSIEQEDKRFNLSVYVEPIDCHFGQSVMEVTRCFLEKSDLIPGMVKEVRKTTCDDRRCEVIYVTAVEVDGHRVVHIHQNSIFVYQNLWVDVHLSASPPRVEDNRIFARLAGTFSYQDQASGTHYP